MTLLPLRSGKMGRHTCHISIREVEENLWGHHSLDMDSGDQTQVVWLLARAVSC